MHWLIELLFDVLFWFLPGYSRWHHDRSIIGKSRLDREADRILILCVLVAATVAALLCCVVFR